MDLVVSVRNVMNQNFVGVSEGDPLVGVADLLTESGDSSAVVLRGTRPVGVVSIHDIITEVAAEKDINKLDAEHVMVNPTTIQVEQPLGAVIESLRDQPVLVVVDDSKVVGMISHSDVIPVVPLMGERYEHEDLTYPHDTLDFEPQGICERCGSLTQTLKEQHGQIVCPDCIPA